jgi:hypothetical protein
MEPISGKQALRVLTGLKWMIALLSHGLYRNKLDYLLVSQ